MSNAISLAKELQQMKAIDVIRNERVRSQFISVYNSIWKEGGEQVYEREAIYFNQQLRDKSNLRECSGTSIFYAFIDLAVKGLTLATGAQALCYLIPRSVKIGTNDKGSDVWEKSAILPFLATENWYSAKMLDRYATPTILSSSTKATVSNMANRTDKK